METNIAQKILKVSHKNIDHQAIHLDGVEVPRKLLVSQKINASLNVEPKCEWNHIPQSLRYSR